MDRGPTKRSHAGEPRRLVVVLAEWCPHCVPLSDRYSKRLARRLGVPILRLDIDHPRQGKLADHYVRCHGDWAPDYLIPQIFLERRGGAVQHILTGFPEGVDRTREAWENLLAHLPPSAAREHSRA